MRVRRSVALGLFVGLLVGGGCSSGDDGVSPQPNDQLLASAVIGAGGGSVTGGAATVTVPPGAFATDVELEIYLSEDDNPFAGSGASALYRLDGVPATCAQPLQVSFPVAPGGTGALVALGEENFVQSAGGLMTGFRMLPTVVTDTTAVASLPAAPDAVSGAPASLPLYLVRVDGFETDDGTTAATTADGSPGAADPRFTVSFPTGRVAEAVQMRLYLEAAYAEITSWPFSFARRTSWPVSVTLMDLKPDVYGYYVPSRMGDNFGSLEFNINKLADPVEARTTAIHELLHLGQALHDNRNRWTKARSASDRYWLDEATAVWSEKRVAGVADYKSRIAAGHQMMPFERFHVPADGAKPDHHGYGSAPLFEYLAGRQGRGVIQQIYQDIFDNGNDPVRAINSVQSDVFMVWHPRFQRELVQGDLTPDVSLADAISAGSGTWQVASKNDTIKTFKADYHEGGARFYFIKPTRTDFSPSAVLEMTLDNTADGLLNVYRYKGPALERLGIAAGSFQVTGLDELVDEGWYLMVMVTDSHLAAPYTAQHSMTLDLKVKNPAGFTLGWANIAGEGHYEVEYTTPDNTWIEEDSYFTSWPGGLQGTEYVAGSGAGNTFTSSFSGLYGGASYTGTLSVTVDDADDPRQVVGFSYEVVRFQSGDSDYRREYRCSGGGVPVVSARNGVYAFTIDGGSAAGAVSQISETESSTSETFQQVATLEGTVITYVTVRLKR